MKKKRLGVFSVLLALMLTMGACSEISDIPNGETKGDDTSENTGNEGSEGGNQNQGSENEGGENENKPTNKSVTITVSPTSITLKENETEYFTISLSDSDASILGVTVADATYIEVGSTDTASQYYVKGLVAGSTSISIAAGGEGFNTATASISVTVETTSSSGEGQGGDMPEQNKDITITAPTTLSVAATEKTYFTIEILPEDTAITYTVVSSDTTVAEVAQDGTQWYVEGKSEGSTTLLVSATGEGYNAASATISVSVTAAPVYTHTLSITNKVLLPTGWKYNTEDSFTIVGVLNTYKDGTYDSGESLSASNCSVTVYSEDYSVNTSILNVSGLTISPKGVGTAIVVVTANDYPDLHDYITITVDDIETTTHSLSVSASGADELTVGDSFSIDVQLTTSVSYGYNTSDSYENTVSAPRSSVNISYDSTKLTETSDFTFTAIGDTGDDKTTITVTWTEFVEEEPETTSGSVSVSIAAKEIHYSLTVTNEDSFTSGTWWTEDGDKELTISITYTQDEDTGSIEVSDLITNGEISVTSYPSGIVESSIEGSKITLTPVSAGNARVTVAWTENAEAVTSFDVTVNEATYKLEITNREAFEQPWKTTDAARTLSIDMTSNREDVTKEVELSYDTDAFNVSGYTFTPLKEGTYTITAIWKGHESAQDSVTVTIDDTVVGAYLDLSDDSIVLDTDTNTSTELTATIYGEDHETLATNQEISWSYTGDDGAISLSSATGSTITVTAVTADTDAVITATSTANEELHASCSVRVNAEAAVEAQAYLNDFVNEVVTTPDNNGVYVFGNEAGNQFISAAGLDDHYYNAASITVLALEEDYNLLLDGHYLTEDLTTSDNQSDAAVFTIESDGAIKLGSASLCLGSTGLTLGDGSQAYLIDQILVPSSGYTASESGFFYAVDSNGVDYYWNGAHTTSSGSYRLTTTKERSEAARINLVNHGGNKYCMMYTDDNEATSYITFSSSNLTMSTSEAYIYYDATNGIWSATATDSSSEYGIFLNSSSGWFTCYQISTHLDGLASSNNQVYPVPTLMSYPSDDEWPNIRGISITAADTEVMAGSSTALTIKYYPSCIENPELTWTITDGTGASTDSAYVEDEVLHLDSTATAGSTITATATSGGVSGSVSITVQGIEYMASESMTASSLGLSNADEFSNYDGTMFTMSANKGTGSSTPAYYTADSSIRIYQNNELYFDLHEGIPYPITKIVITSTSSNHTFSGGTFSNCSIDDSSTTVTITPTDGLSQIYIKPGAQVRIVSLVVYYTDIYSS